MEMIKEEAFVIIVSIEAYKEIFFFFLPGMGLWQMCNLWKKCIKQMIYRKHVHE